MRDDINALRDIFYRAYSGTSFSPEVRAESCVLEFSEELDADLKELGSGSGHYAEKYIGHLRTWALRRSRCMSPMITGPARFPTESNMKKMTYEHNAWIEFRRWRERYIRRASAEKTKSPEEELDDALEAFEKERAYHEMMLGVNRIVRGKMSQEEKLTEMLETFGLHQDTCLKLILDSGFQSFSLTNHNNKVKRLEEKVLIMKTRIQRKETFSKIIFPGGSIDIENDRVVIRHDERPEKEVIEKLRSNGFRWSPNWHCWCRKHTGNAIVAAKRICEVKP